MCAANESFHIFGGAIEFGLVGGAVFTTVIGNIILTCELATASPGEGRRQREFSIDHVTPLRRLAKRWCIGTFVTGRKNGQGLVAK
jgi:hypothetical protein